ncbi:leucine-rich repeat transmembrane protein FLRT2 [Ornithorhynchus anatinus]|uniref:Fibronectin leucine rich transmembrane protein 2 n=1 Tax=Ornithorhynchus anatinus TaxID=9258 RepID=F7D0D5_ORNAN|nr:leucine-rich repeat transmembrane protein FLRT2 [Ornithorhynchus anatinus]XP_007667230.1 leucine-rich repeat transmembrane protein FLRT2 [Ornithorhynchus anatinus]XP_028924473.1 leucine-rich repeat transmembrane protein FLRT2 [Ornithorhynchus anatinus]XP_028924483.1 leucine-rich repeat transmembrane protein FLRT2 [Ornithorhynchus anatinus]
MGLQTMKGPIHRVSFLRSWVIISLGLSMQVSQSVACPSVCRCDRNFVYCNERSLTSVPLGIPEGVTVLYLHNNQINNAGFPAELHNVQSVHTVYLYGNQLDEFPMNLPKNVKVLHLQENNIQTISRAALAQLLKLEELHLDDNSISTVGVEDGAFREAISLKLLFLSKNHLSSVPVGLPVDLQELRVDENRIAVISDMAFQNLTSLERLIVDGNLLTNKGIAEGTFSHLSRLKEFSIVRNSLSHPPPDLPGTHLVRLYLQDNQITHIPLTAFSNLHKLERLDISNNQLRMLVQGVFDDLSNLKQLTARNNPWLCDCSIKWVTEWLRFIPSSLNVRGFMCQGPEQVRGMAVRELNMNLLSCPTTTPVRSLATLSPSPTPTTQLATLPAPTPSKNSTLPMPTQSKLPTVPDWEGRDRATPPIAERIQLSVHFVNDTCIQVSWISIFTVMAYKLTWVKMGHSLVGGIVQERIVSGEKQHLSLVNLEPRSTYRICLVPLDAFNYRAGEETVCSEATTDASPLSNGSSNTASSHEQTTSQSLGSPFLLAGLIGGAVIFVLVVLLSIFCWHMHKKGRYTSQKWKYNRGRRKDDYCEAGTKKDNSILEMTETSFQIVSLNNDQLLKGDFRLQPIYTPNGGINYTDCHIPNNMRYCNSSVPDLEHCHT